MIESSCFFLGEMPIWIEPSWAEAVTELLPRLPCRLPSIAAEKEDLRASVRSASSGLSSNRSFSPQKNLRIPGRLRGAGIQDVQLSSCILSDSVLKTATLEPQGLSRSAP